MKLLPLSLGVALGLLWSSPSLAQSRDQVVRLCLNGLLHTDISHDGTPPTQLSPYRCRSGLGR